jgi:type I restriction enzyme S subunit
MQSPIDLSPRYLHLVRAILKRHVPGREVRAFGSRAVGKAKPTSDLDLCIMGETPLPTGVVEGLRRAFSDSSIPCKIDVVEWAGLREAFRAIIEQTAQPL